MHFALRRLAIVVVGLAVLLAGCASDERTSPAGDVVLPEVPVPSLPSIPPISDPYAVQYEGVPHRAVGRTFQGTTSQGLPIWFSVVEGPLIVGLGVDVRMRCPDGGTITEPWTGGARTDEPLNVERVRVEDGRFVMFKSEPIGQQLRGDLHGARKARGSGRLFTVSYPDETRECDSGRFTWTATGRRTPAVPAEPIALDQAIERGLVLPRIAGLGASSGESIEARFARLVPDPVTIIVPFGLVLKSSDASQNMVTLGRQEITLDEVVSSKRLDAYCLNFHRANPSPQTRFSLAGTVGGRVRGLLETAIRSVPRPSIAVIQIALWVVTDDMGRGELLSRFRASDAELEHARELLVAAGVDPARTKLYG